MTDSTPRPLGSFAPQFLALFVAAARKPVEIEFNDARKAHRLRFRLNQFRRTLYSNSHPMRNLAASVQLTITPTGNLYAAPADSAFLEVLDKALQDSGLDLNDIDIDQQPAQISPTADATAVLQDFFTSPSNDKPKPKTNSEE